RISSSPSCSKSGISASTACGVFSDDFTACKDVPPMALIELRHIRKRFDALVVLNDVSLSVERGQSLVIIGASGSGKSVMLKHMVGLLKPDRGYVFFDGRRIDN